MPTTQSSASPCLRANLQLSFQDSDLSLSQETFLHVAAVVDSIMATTHILLIEVVIILVEHSTQTTLASSTIITISNNNSSSLSLSHSYNKLMEPSRMPQLLLADQGDTLRTVKKSL